MSAETRTKFLIAIVVVIFVGLGIWNYFGWRQSKTDGIIALVLSPVVLVLLGLAGVWMTFSNMDD